MQYINTTHLSVAAFSPTDIAGLNMWLDSSQESFSDNDAVGTATDFSGNNNDATQGTAGAKPTFKTNIINGQPVFRFDGGDFMSAAIGYANAAFTIFVVGSWTSAIFPSIIAEYNSTTSGYLACGLRDLGGGSAAISTHKTGVNTSTSNLTVTTTVPALIAYKSAGISGGTADVLCYKNGTAASGTVQQTTLSTNTAINIGASKGGTADILTGDIAQILIYDSQLSDTNRGLVETYLMDLYGL